MSASDLGRLLGARPLGSAILRRERQLSKANILKLADHFRVDPGLFLGSGHRPHAREQQVTKQANGMR